MAGTFAENYQNLYEELSHLPDPQDRLSLLMDRSRNRKPLPAESRTEGNRVKGCISAVWLIHEYKDGRCHFRVGAESPMVGALAYLYQDLYNRLPPHEVVAGNNRLLEELGLASRLSGTRVTGMAALDLRFKQLAIEASVEGKA